MQLSQLDNSSFCNDYGSIRVKLVRKYIDKKNLNSPKIEQIKELYTTWRDTVEILPLKLVFYDEKVFFVPDLNTTTEKYCNYLGAHGIKYSNYLDFVFIEGERYEWSPKICCKRGNKVYVDIVKEKFSPLVHSDKHKQFFSTQINKKRLRVRKTKLLYLTGTCNHDITGNISNSWDSFGSYWNSFITNIRDQFGKVEFLRAWQSQKNGYPHYHALVYFYDFDFTVTYWEPDKSWRVHNRQKHKGKFVRDKLKKAWKWGNLEIKCCDNTKKALTDILKYITRDLEGGGSDLTNAMAWYFGKRSYSFSKGFPAIFAGNISIAEPSNADLINASGVIQSNNSKEILKRIEVYPILKRDLLPRFTQLTIENWRNPPEPPPEVVDYLDRLALDCKVSKFIQNKELPNGNFIDIVIYKRKDCYDTW